MHYPAECSSSLILFFFFLLILVWPDSLFFRELKKSQTSSKSYFLPRRTLEENESCELWCLPRCALCSLSWRLYFKTRNFLALLGHILVFDLCKREKKKTTKPSMLSPLLFSFMLLGGGKKKKTPQWLLCLSSFSSITLINFFFKYFLRDSCFVFFSLGLGDLGFLIWFGLVLAQSLKRRQIVFLQLEQKIVFFYKLSFMSFIILWKIDSVPQKKTIKSFHSRGKNYWI